MELNQVSHTAILLLICRAVAAGINFRNFAVHEYFSVNWRIVWDTATVDIPPIEKQIANLLKKF